MSVRLILRERPLRWIEESALGPICSLCRELGLRTHFDGRGRELHIESPVQDRTVVIDADGDHDGAWTMAVAGDLQRLLTGAGARVILIREDAAGRPPRERVRLAREARGAVLIAIRSAARSGGMAVVYSYPAIFSSRRLAHGVAAAVSRAAGGPDRVVRVRWTLPGEQTGYGILAAAAGPAIAVDCDRDWAPAEAWARGVYAGVRRYFGGGSETASLPLPADQSHAAEGIDSPGEPAAVAQPPSAGRAEAPEAGPGRAGAPSAAQVFPPKAVAGVKIATAKVRTDWFNPPGGGPAHVFRPGAASPRPGLPDRPGQEREKKAPPRPVQSDVHRFP